MKALGSALFFAFSVAIATPALATPKTEAGVPEAQRKIGMAKAPEIIAKSGLACGLTDARFVGTSDENKDGVKVTTAFFEVACTEGLGYIIQAKTDGSMPLTYDCVATSNSVIGPDGKPEKNSLACTLPGNANPIAGLQPLIDKTGSQCIVDNARYIGVSPSQVYYELVCRTGDDLVMIANLPTIKERKVTRINCLTFEYQQSGIKCVLPKSVQTVSPNFDLTRGAAVEGEAWAQGSLGYMYEQGQGVARDDALALTWYLKAAEQGSARAQWDVGRLYFTGKGVGQDQSAAVNWFRKAADQGWPDAKEMLNAIAENERVTQNINKPKNLLYLSCRINFETPIDAAITINFDNETANGYPAIISQNEIKFTISATTEEKANWFKKREKSHENSITINRINGFFITTSDFYGPTVGNCNKVEGPKF